MAIFKRIFGLLLLSASSCALQDPLQLTGSVQITPYIQRKALLNHVGDFPGARNCGGAGRFIKISLDQCAADGPSPCEIPANDVRQTEMVFVPSASTRGLGVTTRIIADGTAKTYERFLPDVSVVAGHEYVMAGTGSATSELKGKHVITQVEIFRMADRQVESCGEIETLVV